MGSIIDSKRKVFAVVTKREGSVPRGPGAWIIVGEDGPACGTVGGGQIEQKVISQALKMIEEDENFVSENFTLEVRPGNDLNMVCGGNAEVWFARIGSDTDIDRIENSKDKYLIIDSADGSLSFSDDGEHDIPYGGKVIGDRYIMPLKVKERVVIFGGGHVARALVKLISEVGFSPVVFENRPDFANSEFLPQADEIICGDYMKVDESISLTDQDYIVIMTHGHGFDMEIEKQILTRKFAYVGMMGSRRKKAAIEEKLLDSGLTREQIDLVHTPIGLDIGAETPEEIAVSIAAEIISVRAGLRRPK